MKTKNINVVVEEVKTVAFIIDLKDLETYKSRFLALKNHERETDSILEVSGWRGSNSVRVVMWVDAENETDEKEEIERCKEFVEQFGEIERVESDTAYILDIGFLSGCRDQIDYKDLYLIK